MARLNEAGAAAAAHAAHTSNETQQSNAESFETGKQTSHIPMRSTNGHTKSESVADNGQVKRSLMRQNRQIARSHSTQSLQIRTLSSTISGLLTTNCALREENIRLRKELEDARSLVTKSELNKVKETWKAHLKDLTALIEGLDTPVGRAVSPQTSPETRKNWCLESMHFRDRPSLREIMEDSRLPALEEVSAMLEGQSIARLSDGSTVSADLGPPPVARADLNIQEANDVADASTAESSEHDLAIVQASMNIEARKRRKPSVSGRARRRSTMVAPMSSPEHEASPVKAGEKRKLADREGAEPDNGKENDDFQFTRRNSSSEPAKLSAPVPSIRRVLGAKSTNISPKKQKVEEAENKPDKSSVSYNPGSRRRPSRLSALPISRTESDHADVCDVPTTIEGRHAGRQPGDSSPQLNAVTIDAPAIRKPSESFPHLPTTSSEPLQIRLHGDLDSSPRADVVAVVANDARPSRRARAAVNYAEPSLVAKMRRPGKEMLDALSGLQDPKNVMSTSTRRTSKATAAPESKAHNQRSPIVRKVEDEEEDLLSPVDEPAIQTSLSLAALCSQQAIDHALDIYNFDETSPPHSPEALSSRMKQRRHSSTTKLGLSDPKLASKTPSIMATKAAIRRKSMMI